MRQKTGLHEAMSETEFDNGYWYVAELRDFALRIGIAETRRLRKDELERAIKHFIRTGEARSPVSRPRSKPADRDVDKGLRLDQPIVHYTSNRETKDFIEREARRIEPGFRRKSGTRYLLNRWREEQLANGRRITYGDLVEQAIALNKTKRGPLRVEHGRYINFISDFVAANRTASRAQAIEAWEDVKRMDVPKTYRAWVKARRS